MAKGWIRAYDITGFIRASHISAIFVGRRPLRNCDGFVVRDHNGKTTEGYGVCASVRGSTYQISKVFAVLEHAEKELNRLVGITKHRSKRDEEEKED